MTYEENMRERLIIYDARYTHTNMSPARDADEQKLRDKKKNILGHEKGGSQTQNFPHIAQKTSVSSSLRTEDW